MAPITRVTDIIAVRHKLCAVLTPYRVAPSADLDVLRFLVTRTRLNAQGKSSGLALAHLFNEWATGINLPTLSYTDIVTALENIIIAAPPGCAVTLSHGATTTLAGLTRTPTSVTTSSVLPSPDPAFKVRMSKAAQGLKGYAPDTACEDLLALKFLELFTEEDAGATLRQHEVEAAYAMWSTFTGVPIDKTTAVWMRIAQHAITALNSKPIMGGPLRGIRLI